LDDPAIRNPAYFALTDQQLSEIDALCDRFDQALVKGHAPRIETFLVEAPDAAREGLLAELLAMEVEHRTKQGDAPKQEEYIQRFPQQKRVVADLFARDTKTLFSDDRGTISSPGNLPPVLANFRLIKQIGQGGMGVVWLAEQDQPVKRRVALKLIKSEFNSKDVIARFDAEKQALAMMDHPNIARVLDAGTTDDRRPYFVMELVDGISITQYCDDNKLSIDDRLKLFVQVCKAVQHAHQKGIIHRDLKPSNVLVTVIDGEAVPKVIDFGLAKAVERNLQLTDATMQTEFGKVVGTVQYMSPEQAELKGADSLDIDTRTDVYSLGVMLYELLTGSTPVDKEILGRNALLKILELIRDQDPPRPSSRLSSSSGDVNSVVSDLRRLHPARLQQLLRGELDWIVMKALEKDRTRRYDTADGFARDIQRYLADEVVEARPPSQGYRLKKFVRRNKVQVIAGSLVLLSLVVGFVGTTIGVIEAGKQTKNARLAEGKAEAEAIIARTAEGTAMKQLLRAEGLVYAGKLSLAQSAFAEGKGEDAVQHLEECQWNLRGWEHRHLSTRFNSKQTLEGHTSEVSSVSWSPDGKFILTGSGDNTAKVWNAEKGQEVLTLKGHTLPVRSVSWSPDGKRILTGSDDTTAKVWDAATGQELLTLTGHTGEVSSAAWSPDGKRILTGSYDKTAKVWDAEKGQELVAVEGHMGSLFSVSWSPDGKRILTGSEDKTAKVWDVATGQEVITLTGHSLQVSSVSWSPDGKRILTGSYDKTAKVWDAEMGQELVTFKGHVGSLFSAAWSPDGKRILTGSYDNTAKVWDAETGQELLALKGHKQFVLSAAWSPDGKRILTGSQDKTTKVWDAEKGQEVLTLKGHLNWVFSAAWSPDGKRILTGSADKTAKVWNAATGQEVLNLKEHINWVSSVSWSPDGKRILTGSEDKSAKVWDAKTGQELLTVNGHSAGVMCVSWSPDGNRIVTGSEDTTAKVWDVATGQEVLALKGHTSWVSGVAWSPDGKRILTGSADLTAKVWDAETGQELLTLNEHTDRVNGVAWSADGQRILTGSHDNTAKVWDAATGHEVLTLTGHTLPVSSVSWSPDGKRILTGSWDYHAKVWDAVTGQEVVTLKGHSDGLFAVSWSPDGERIVTGGGDKTAMVWDAEKREEILAVTGHASGVSSVAWSPDGKKVFAWNDAGRVLAWDTTTGQPVAADNPPSKPAPGPARSPDGRFNAIPKGSQIQLVDSLRPAPVGSPWPFPEAAQRTTYHTEQAAVAQQEKQWFAVAFHVGRLLLDDPDNADLKKRSEDALQHAGR
jgi:eukaryotic-like serine/threonine-protein kinase